VAYQGLKKKGKNKKETNLAKDIDDFKFIKNYDFKEPEQGVLKKNQDYFVMWKEDFS
jgi:hypothetical protein